jgi:indolepyruvate ferredoxin oxidoreductase alpha subunit
MKVKKLLLGDEAVALGAINAGITGVYAYPGTPSTEITEYIQGSETAREAGIHCTWCTNEKTAMETALGVSYVGQRAIVCMKHVGLNVAADAFVNSAITGINGGVIVVVADDPSMHSSQNEQDSRFYGKFAFIPILEPSDQQEAYDMMEYGFRLSEEHNIPVMLRLTTRMAHSRAVVEVATKPIPRRKELTFPKDPSSWILLPANARRKYPQVIANYEELERVSTSKEGWNRYFDAPDKSLGVIACGIAYNYLRENVGMNYSHPILKISQYPAPSDLIRKMASECNSILVIEEGQPLLEERIKGILPSPVKVLGRLSGALPRVGELNPNSVRVALEMPAHETNQPSSVVVPRPPALCQGCGHRDVYAALNEVLTDYPGHKVFSDIGCYTLGALPPFRTISSCIDMGSSITVARGAADAGLWPSVAVIGDSTFTHSGITSLLDAANVNANIVVIISDNLTTGMTGGQDSAGTGKLEAICAAVGVDPAHIRTVIPLPKNMPEITRIIREEIEYEGLSVIIPRRECIQTAKRHAKERKK